jgi:hypothetical protein
VLTKEGVGVDFQPEDRVAAEYEEEVRDRAEG